MPCGVSIGLIEGLPAGASYHIGEHGLNLDSMLLVRLVEQVFESNRILLKVGGAKRGRIPPPLVLLSPKRHGRRSSGDPVAWSLALGGAVEQV